LLENVLVILLVVLLFLIAFLLIRTILYGHLAETPESVDLPEVNPDVVAEHLAAVLRHPTISYDDRSQIDYQPFLNFRKELEKLYPRVHATLHIQQVNRHSLMYTWPGRDDSLEPVLLAGHMDVVPVDPSSRDEWRFPPFEGRIFDGAVWGRGALDTKNSVIAALEAVETLLKNGFQPQRTLILGFGHDEEIGGFQGAAQIAGHLLASGVHLAALLDEGGGVMRDGIPGVRMPVAVVGVAEKGYLTLELKVEARGGHSSIPPAHTSIGVLARALSRLEANPMPIHLEMADRFFRYLGAYLPFYFRLVLANQWLFKGPIRARMTADPRTNALVRTTTAVTMISGGMKDNLLPAQARAAVNFRLMPGDRIADLEMHARKIIHDEAVQLHIPEGAAWEASPMTPFDSPISKGLLKTLGQVYPEAVAVPFLVPGTTDSRHYIPVCENIFKFSPFLISTEELSTVHSTNEHITQASLARMVQFYIQLVKNWTG
jgi:carboxypeptidase PM20D1